MPTLVARSRALLFSLCLLCPLALSVRPGDAAAPIVTPTRGGVLVDGLLEDPDHLLPNFSRRF